MDPINYQIDVQNPFQAGLQGYQQGLAINAMQQQAQAAEAQRQAQLKLQQDMYKLATKSDLTSDDIARFTLQNPQLSEQYARSTKMLDESQKQTALKQGMSVFGPLLAGKKELAISSVDELIKANENSGNVDEVTKLKSMKQLIETNDKAAMVSMAPQLAAIMGPEKFAENIKALAPEIAKKEELAPSVKEAIDFQNLSVDQQKIFTSLQALKHPVAVTNIQLDKSSQEELGKLVPVLYDKANSAADQLAQIPRLRETLKTAITGPLANQRLSAARLGNALGFTGDKTIAATTELMQGLADMALKARGELRGQGSITDAEQKILLKARAGDINFTVPEMETLFNVSERASKVNYERSRKMLESASKKSDTAAMFLQNLSPVEQLQTKPTVQVTTTGTNIPVSNW